MNYNVITFYQYKEIEDPNHLRDTFKTFCKKNNIKGRILIAHEGINGGACGLKDDIENFKQFNEGFFPGMSYREIDCEEQCYHKLVCKVRKEIVVFGEEVDLSNKGLYVTPSQLHDMYENKEDFVIIDARNDYEAKIGIFEDATVLPIETFRELPQELEKHPELKDKKVVMYCTGGIRCEKATAYLKEQGFKDVNHLKGGIIEYMHQYPQGHYKGQLFVFDDRKTAFDGDPIVDCEVCGKDSDTILNCHNLDCDKLFVCCNNCAQQLNKCCCEACKQAPRQRPAPKQPKTKIGKVLHFYQKPKVAHVKVNTKIAVGDTIGIQGKTTKLEQVKIKEMRSEDNEPIEVAQPGAAVTIKIDHRVRVNDMLVV